MWAGHVTRVGRREIHKHYSGSPRYRHRRKDNIKMNLKEIGSECVNWTRFRIGPSCGSYIRGYEASSSIKCRDFFWPVERPSVSQGGFCLMDIVNAN